MAAVAIIAVVVAHPLCNLFFRCGCGWLGPAHCNVHQLVGLKCPWCVAYWRFPLVGLAWAAGAWLGARLARRQFGAGGAVAFAGGMVGFLVAAVASGGVTAAATGYPHFIVW